jgi:cysteine desulfurase
MVRALDVMGNPSSVHGEGRAARRLLEAAREALAAHFCCAPAAITFTSGATEGLHLALESAHALGFGPCFIGAGEHDAAFAKAQLLYPDAQTIPINLDTVPDRDWLAAQLDRAGGPPLIVMQAANNETGALTAVARIGEMARARGGAVVCDATQLVGKIGFGAIAGAADWIVASSHKIGGPMGAGCIITAPGVSLVNLRPGGGQELGARAGTQNVAAIAGFAAAADVCATDEACAEFQANMATERDAFEAAVSAALPERVIIAQWALRLANTSCIALPGWGAEKQVIALDLAGAAVSAGAACSSGKVKASRVLQAAGYEDAVAGSAIRVSFGWSNAVGDGERLAGLYIKAARGRRPAAKET